MTTTQQCLLAEPDAGKRSRQRLQAMALMGLLILMTAIAAQSQALPLKKTYGIGDREFLLSGEITKWDADSFYNFSSRWLFSQSMGLNVIYMPVNPSQLSDLVHSGNRRGDTDRIVVNGFGSNPEWLAGGFGRELQFYPFDASQSPHVVWKFTQRDTRGYLDSTNLNGQTLYEWVYPPDSVPAGTKIAWNIALDYKPLQAFRYRYNPLGFLHDPDSVQQTSHFLSHAKYRWFLPQTDTFFVAATGHLAQLPDTTVANGTNLLKIEVWYEIPKGNIYRHADNSYSADPDNTEIIVDSIFVKKGDLSKHLNEAWNAYQTISIPINMARCLDGSSGPLAAPMDSNQFDIRVYYLGHEQVYLRSVAIRDYLGEMMLGTRAAAVAYRHAVLQSAKQYLRDDSSDAGSLRSAVIRLESGTEPDYTEFAGYKVIDWMLRDVYNLQAQVSRLPN